MSKLFFCGVFFTILYTVFAVELKCYQCSPVTSECLDVHAEIVKCGDASMSRCSRQVRRDSVDKTKAVRKCVIPDNAGNVRCPPGYDCFNCGEDLCNANFVSTTTAQPNSGEKANVWSVPMGLFLSLGIYNLG